MFDKVKDMAADATLTTGTAADLGYGYWLIAETTIGTLEDGSAGVATRILLDTAGTEDLTITAKESYPTPEKKITAVTNGAVKDDDSATAQVGDLVTFEISANLPNNVEIYKDAIGTQGYKFKFSDTLSNGLDFVAISSVTIDNKTADSTKYTATTAAHSLEIDWANILADTNAANGVVVKVTYTARVNASAQTGIAGNPNTFKITYSNNPNSDGTGESVPVEVKVYTFKLDIVKTKAENEFLAGAGFVLKNAEGKYYKFDAAVAAVEDDPETTDVDESVAAQAAAVSWVTDIKEATEYTSNATDGKLDGDFVGLPEGTYTIVEKTVPTGYNKANDISFTVSAAAVATDDTITVTMTPTPEGAVTADANYDFHSTILNQTGTELPSTGGIGTTIFYVVGSILVVAAGVLLITKKRMSREG